MRSDGLECESGTWGNCRQELMFREREQEMFRERTVNFRI